jgi:hypothetical protein
MRTNIVIAFVLIIFIACDAPRVNPFDPNSETYQSDAPILSSTEFISSFENFNSRTTLTFQTNVTPQNNTIISKAEILLSESNYIQELPRIKAGAVNTYKLDMPLESIDSLLTPENIVEKNFEIKLTTAKNEVFLYSPFHIRRVIMEDLNLLLPEPDSEQSGEVLFTWVPIKLNYDFTFRIEVYTLQQFGLIGKIENIPSDSTNFLLEDQSILNKLDNLDNFWALFIVDKMGNSCKSTFNIFNYTR